MSFLLRLTSRFRGRQVGTDRFGNIYYESARSLPNYPRPRRWVVYAGAPDPTMVPPEWHCWLHFLTDAPLPEKQLYPWQKPHQPNLTGTPQAWRPKGHPSQGGKRVAASSDYEAWTPGA